MRFNRHGDEMAARFGVVLGSFGWVLALGVIASGWIGPLGLLLAMALMPIVALFSTVAGPWYGPGGSQKSLDDLRDEPEVVPSFEASVFVCRRGIPIREDVALVSFVDGWMLVAGLEHTFALPESEVEGTVSPWMMRAIGAGEWVNEKCLRLRDAPEWSIVLRERFHDLRWQSPAGLRNAIEKWLVQRTPVEGEPIFPQLTAQPGLARYPAFNAAVAFFSLGGIVGILALAGGMGHMDGASAFVVFESVFFGIAHYLIRFSTSAYWLGCLSWFRLDEPKPISAKHLELPSGF